MKNVFKISAFLMFLVLGSSAELMAQDQKFGYLNSQNLLVMLPESETADKALQQFQEKLAADFQKKIEKFQADATAFETKAQGGEYTQIQIQELSTTLQKRQETLGKEEYALGEQVNVKRNELLNPILEKIDKAIKEVGKEGSYTMIFDSSGMNLMLYTDTSTDVLELVKTKLGL